MASSSSKLLAERPLRKYEPIWREIKKKGSCTVKCHPLTFNTVKQGVIQEKRKDIGFKIINEVENFWLEITYNEQKQHLTFTLKSKWGLEKIKS